MMDIFHPCKTENIYICCKEAINNAVKYSNAANIDFSIQKKTTWQVEIKDDGSGFIPRAHTGNGIYNMHARAKELNGLLQIDSTGQHPQFGSSLIFTQLRYSLSVQVDVTLIKVNFGNQGSYIRGQ